MSQIKYADIEIGLAALNGHRYRVDIQFYPPADAGDDARQPRVSGEARLDPQEFLNKSAEDYGRLLSERLFENPKVRDVFVLARAGTYGRANDPFGLRVRLWFDPSAERLYDLRWETLYDPVGQVPLSTHDLIPLSRFPASDRNRPVQVRPKGDLRALVVIASPEFEEDADGGNRALAVVSVEDEWNRVRATLGALAACRLLARHPDAAGKPTAEALQNELNSTGYDIIYIVCHGVLDPIYGAYLLLEDDQGKRKDMQGPAFLQALEAGSQACPRLVVLTACQSAGTSLSTDNRAHLALGPGLIRAGVPAVLAMNGKISMATSAEFYTRFFAELQKHGCVDRAMTTARRAVQAIPRSDWWMPTLYMRLSAGCIWSVPHLIQRDQEPYQELSLSLQSDSCVPIVGPAMVEPRARWRAAWRRRSGSPWRRFAGRICRPSRSMWLAAEPGRTVARTR